MHIPAHSPWLPGYIHVAQTVLTILTMAGLFPERPHVVLCYSLETSYMQSADEITGLLG